MKREEIKLNVEIAKNLLDLDTENKIVIRKDSVVHPTGNPKFSEFTVRKTKAEDIPVGFTPYDIGPQTVEIFNQHIMSAKTIFANGPPVDQLCQVFPPPFPPLPLPPLDSQSADGSSSGMPWACHSRHCSAVYS